MIRAAVYARKSSDDSDRDAEAQSCQRQIDAATRYATEQGWVVDPRHVYRDDAVSGAEWKHRDGWNKLLADLEPSPAFSRLIVSELSRIGRDTVRTPAAILAVEEAGVEIFSYLGRQQITLSSEMGSAARAAMAPWGRTRAADAGGVVTTGAVPTTIVDWSAAAMGSECWLTRWTGACSMLSPRRSPRRR